VIIEETIKYVPEVVRVSIAGDITGGTAGVKLVVKKKEVDGDREFGVSSISCSQADVPADVFNLEAATAWVESLLGGR
jgi:hypothetical protein